MSPVIVAFVIALNLGLIYVLMALPLGRRQVIAEGEVRSGRDEVWQALHPLGRDAGWSGEIVSAEPFGRVEEMARLRLSWLGRDSQPITRDVRLSDVVTGFSFSQTVVDDSSLDPAFWSDYRQDVRLKDTTQGTRIVIVETDRYRGAAFLILRHFALRRRLARLRQWLETGRVRKGGWFEHPATQFGFALVSVLILWPLFGLTGVGLMLAAALTLVVALHELGHMAAFRISGHRSVRMIFIPLLGGIAIGGRPYDSRFEVGFVAVMGPGFSAFLVVPVMVAVTTLEAAGATREALGAAVFLGFLSLFNLANLVPMWKFDGGQVVRQVADGRFAQAIAACLLLLSFLAAGHLAGFSTQALAIGGAVLAAISLMTAGSGVAPRKPLRPLDGRERAGLASALLAVFTIHAAGLVWSAAILFPTG